MNKLKQLEIKKLIKELDYIESDFEYKSEIIVENDSTFMKDVNSFLERNPKLKEMFDKKINDRIEDIIKKNTQNENTDITKHEEPEGILEGESTESNIQDDVIYEEMQEDCEDTKNSRSKIKKLYREIVKKTHPDRVGNKKLNELYIKATGMYDSNDIAGIYSICNELKIDYEIDEEDSENITTKIKTLRERVGFIESTFTWKWHYSKTSQEKEQLIFLYIRTQLQ